MSYKKYSPFLKSVKVLMLLSFMYFTARLDASVDLHIPVTMQKFDYKSLPVYCKTNTKHFECKLDNGEIYCLPESYKCRIKCANDAELRCKYSATTCETGEFQCNRGNNSTSPIMCIPNEHLCDGHLHCPLQDDEDLEMCKRRSCGPNQIPCQSPGHCIAASRRCDGYLDCRRAGFNDRSDEQNCMNKQLQMSMCTTEQFVCKDGHGCADKNFVCDGFADCADGSDEKDCALVQLQCKANEFKCDDGRCMKNSLRCDNKADCPKGEDEKNCKSKCQFDSEFHCRNNDKCVSQIFLCDGTDDCGSGDDEVCPITSDYCLTSRYWTCKTGNHCIIADYRCDSKLHCPDGSDELDCPTAVPPPAIVVCPPGHHRCNGTNTCVDVAAACAGLASCPQPDSQLEAACHRSSPCQTNNGGCSKTQVCKTAMDGAIPVAVCGCQPGYQIPSSNPHDCVDVDECKHFGSCAQLCNNTVGSFSCSCLTGYRSHGSDCLAHGAAKLLFSTDSTIEYMDLETGHRVNVLSGLHYPKYLAYDFAEKKIFYHGRHGVVGSVRLDGTGHNTILRGLTADAIAYDWTRHLLFYSMPKFHGSVGSSGHIGVIDVNTGRRTILYMTDCPWGLAVNPRQFALYFTLRCTSPNGVYTMKMDGSGFHLLLDVAGGLPGHLAIDLAQKPERLYWMDTLRNGIYSGTVDGGDLRVHMHHKSLFDVALFQDQMYFSNLQHGELRSASKFLSDPHVETKLKANSVLSVTVYHSLLQPRAESMPECDCQHICLAPPAGTLTRSCLCDINYRMDPVSGLCVNGTSAGADAADSWPSPPTAPSKDAAANSLLEGRVGSIAGIVIGALCVCLILGVTVAMYCLRVQDRQSINLNVSHEPHCKEVGSMPKVNSRTPLTECEVDMDNSKF